MRERGKESWLARRTPVVRRRAEKEIKIEGKEKREKEESGSTTWYVLTGQF